MVVNSISICIHAITSKILTIFQPFLNCCGSFSILPMNKLYNTGTKNKNIEKIRSRKNEENKPNWCLTSIQKSPVKAADTVYAMYHKNVLSRYKKNWYAAKIVIKNKHPVRRESNKKSKRLLEALSK